MPIIDFREIPEAYIASGEQDSFEHFARDFFEDVLGFRVLSEPCRGADCGKDILLEELQAGSLSESKIIWLVSCKHKAHSGLSVSPSDEENIVDRMKQFGAQGFIGFYSTLPSSSLNSRLDSFKATNKIEIFDKERIEKSILNSKNYVLFKRYFPVSYQTWIDERSRSTPSKILDKYTPLPCCICGRDLLSAEHADDLYNGMIGFVIDRKTQEYVSIYAACKCKCDQIMQARFKESGFITNWDDIGDLAIPTIYLSRFLALLNQFHSGKCRFSDDAFDEYKDVLISLSQLVFRQLTKVQESRVIRISEFPDGV